MASLDEQIKNIMVVMRRLAEPNGLTTSDLEWGEEQVKALISDQVAKARIDELNRIPRTNYGNDFAIHINAYLDDRIAELRSKE